MTHADDEGGGPVLTWDDVVARRLERHGLAAAASRLDAPADAVAAVAAVHAQVPLASDLSVALRTHGCTRDDVRAALWDDHTLVRTYGPRGTIHLLAAADLPRWTGMLATLPPQTSGYSEHERFSPEETDEIVAAMADCLAAAELTADELTEALLDSVGRWAVEPRITTFTTGQPRWRLALHTAGWRGALVFGPNRGRTVTYTNPRRWLPGFAPAAPAPSTAEIVLRYLHAFGPATPAHVARWLALPKGLKGRGWADRCWAELGAQIEPVEVDGETGWVPAGDTAPPSGPPSGVRLLPYFDAYGVGCHPRERVFPGRASERALAGGQAGNYPLLLVDGTVAGVWHLRRSGRRAAITVEPLAALRAAQRRALEAEVERVGRILGAEASLTVGTVTVGPHA